MPVLTGGNVIEGGAKTEYSMAGVPTNGTDEVQTITIGGTPEASSTFRLTLDGWTTDPIVWSATNNTLRDHVDAALEALPNVGTGGVVTAVGTMTSGVGTLTLTFSGTRLKKKNIALAVGSAFLKSDGTASTGTVAVATTTAGVDASFRDANTGDKLTDSTNGVEYVNTGVPGAPVWTASSVGGISQEIIDLAAAIPTAAVADISGTNTTAITAHTALTAIAASYADLAAARTSVNSLRGEVETALALHDTGLTTLRSEVETRLDNIETKLNDLLAKLRTAGVVTP